MDDDFLITFRADYGQAMADGRALRTNLEQIVASLRSVGAESSAIDRVAKSVTRFSDATRDATQHTKSDQERNAASARTYSNLSTEIDAAIKLRKEESKSFADLTKARMQEQQQAINAYKKYDSDRESAYKEQAKREQMAAKETAAAQKRYAAEYAAVQKKYDADREAAYKENAAREKAANAAQIAAAKEQLAALQQINSVNEKRVATEERIARAQRRTDNKTAAADWDREFTAASKAAEANERHSQSINATRYALYDVSNAVGIASAAMLGLSAAVFGVGIAWERNFTNVIRVSGLDATSEQVNTLRRNFMELASEIPLASAEIAEIGTLGLQLGIQAQDITNFVQSVAQFSSAAGITAEAAATAFGRLNTLLPDLQGNFNLLGSMIAKTGVNSVATEAQIVAVSSQIASMGTLAGLSSDEVIALASAMASLGIAPELARSLITSSFTKIITAVAQGTDKVEKFGAVLGMSGAEFQKAWREDAVGTFRDLLGTIAAQGDKAVITLDDLGLASQRNTPGLLKLGQNVDILNQALADTASQLGANNATELLRQYGITSETVAAKLQLFTNNIENLMASIAQGGGVFGGLLDMVNDLLVSLTELSQNPVSNFFLQTGAIVTALIAIFGLGIAAALRVQASLLGMATAFNVTTVSANGTRLSMAAIVAQMFATERGANAAKIAVTGVGVALKGLVAVAIAGAILAIASGLTDMALEASGASVSVDKLAQTLLDSKDSVKTLNDELGRNGNVFFRTANVDARLLGEQLKNLSKYSDGAFRDFAAFLGKSALLGDSMFTAVNDNVNKFDEALERLAKSGSYAVALEKAEEFRKQFNLTPDESQLLLDNFYKQVALAATDAGVSTDSFKASTIEAGAAEIVAADAAEELANKIAFATEALGLSEEGYDQYVKAIQSGSAAFGGVSGAFARVQEDMKAWATAQAEATEDSTDSWENFYNGTDVTLQQLSDALALQISEQEAWAVDIGTIAARGAGNFAGALAQMGPEGAALAKLAANATADELMKLEEQARLAAFLASEAFANQFTQSTPQMVAAFQAGGIEAVQGLIRAQIAESSGQTPGAVNAFIQDWNRTYANNPIKMPVGADVTPANQALTDVYNGWSGRRITLIVDSVTGDTTGFRVPGTSVYGYASGGHVRGPGTGISDSIPARLSNGEYVIRAAAVRKFGTGMFDSLNRGVAKFASGGQVGAPREVISHASPVDRAIMRQQGSSRTIEIYLDGRVIATAVDNANANQQSNGSN